MTLVLIAYILHDLLFTQVLQFRYHAYLDDDVKHLYFLSWETQHSMIQHPAAA